MKNSNNKILTIAVVLLLLTNIALVVFMMKGSNSHYGKHPGGRDEPFEMMVKELNMTEQQQKDFKQQKEEHFKNIKPLFDSVRAIWQPDDGSLGELVHNYDLTDALSPFLDGTAPPVLRASISSTKKLIRQGDLVVSRLRSYLKEIAIVQVGDGLPMVASTEFIVLRPKSTATLPVEALLIYLRSQLPQLVFKWSQDGSNHPRFDERELLRLPVPRVLIATPDDYVQAVRTMIASRGRATQLLDAAKRAVEIAIEKDEAAGLAYLKSQLQ